MPIFENIKRYATEKNISITALEQKAKIPNGSIGKWRVSNPTVANLKSVADVLDVTVDQLLQSN